MCQLIGNDEKYLVKFKKKSYDIYFIIALYYWLLTRKNDKCIEFKVHLIHSKQIPLLHSAVLVYAMKELDWWSCPCLSQQSSFHLAAVMIHADCMCRLFSTFTVNGLHV